MAICVKLWLKELVDNIDVLDDVIAMVMSVVVVPWVGGATGVVAVEILVKSLLAASGMTMGAPSRTRTQKAVKKLLFYYSPPKTTRSLYIN